LDISLDMSDIALVSLYHTLAYLSYPHLDRTRLNTRVRQ